jgi:hypothetical protein|tara:strand:+ start:1840 stop:2133 length:294 start_codon:yes stop_codon:yes gene_type:complete
MEEFRNEQLQERQTLIQAFERLDHKCSQLSELAELTERLNEKLNRTEGRSRPEGDVAVKQKEDNRNIVEMFNFIADRMEVQINEIGNNTEKALKMID